MHIRSQVSTKITSGEPFIFVVVRIAAELLMRHVRRLLAIWMTLDDTRASFTGALCKDQAALVRDRSGP